MKSSHLTSTMMLHYLIKLCSKYKKNFSYISYKKYKVCEQPDTEQVIYGHY